MGTIIIGAGHAGASVAAELRRAGYGESIVLIGDEPHLPYQRPPLSKAWLKGEADQESISLRPFEWYENNHVTLLRSRSVQSIDRARKQVRLDGDDALSYDHLVLATGSRCRELNISGAELSGVLSLRTAKDAEDMKGRLEPGMNLVIIGGGYVGLEIAASIRSKGISVLVLEREPRVLARVACPELSNFFSQLHQDQGVTIRTGATTKGFVGKDGRVTGILLDDHTQVACDLAIVGIGAIPNDELARAAGLDCDDGVLVDECARTSDPSVFAIGDVARRWMRRYNRRIRFESVPNALEQAKQVAAAMTGKPALAEELPWFWSDQYGAKLQIAGMTFDCDRVISRGDPTTGRFSLFHLTGDVVRAVEAVNSPGEFMYGKTLISNRIAVDPAKLADTSVPIRETNRETTP